MAPKLFQLYRKGVYIMKSRIQIRNCKSVTTAARMRVVLQEEWDWIAIEEINALFQRLPTVMQRCIAVDGGKLSSFSVISLGTGFNSVLFPCILLLLGFTTSLESSCLDHYWWRTVWESRCEVGLGIAGSGFVLFPVLLSRT